MHNVHYIVINADSAEDACECARNKIENWGSENNHRSICGCIGEDENTYRTKEGRWDIPKTLKQISNEIRHAADNFSLANLFPEVIARFKIDEDTMGTTDWYILEQYCIFKSEQCRFNHKNFNIWEDEHRSWQLSYYGITNMTDGESIEGMKKYIVIIDMHS